MADIIINQAHPAKITTTLSIRAFDLIASSLGLLLLAPVFLLIGLVVKFTSAGPVFYRAQRVGKDGELFQLYKFRSMYLDADRRGPAITVQNDARITPVGRHLRNTKLDELPQLINVFRGQMSLVGPRPEDPRYVDLYSLEQRQVLAVRPGITGPASFHFRAEETLLGGDDWEKVYREQILPHKLALDLDYLQRRTVWTDVALILKTIVAIVGGRDYLGIVLHLRNRHMLAFDILALSTLPALDLTLRLDDQDWLPRMGNSLVLFTVVALLVKLPLFYKLGLYNRYWRYAGVRDLIDIAIAVGATTTILSALFWVGYPILSQNSLAMYRTVPIIDGMLTLLAVGGSRFGVRALYSWYHQRQHAVEAQRVLIVGAGESGRMVVREIRANSQLRMKPTVFVDDDPLKVNTYIEGLPVLGSTHDIPKLINVYNIQQIVVAIPSAPLRRQQELITACKACGVITHHVPGVYELLAGHKSISRLPQVDVNRLLGREPVRIDQTEVGAMISGGTVLVTGAGGSIGSELCRQIAQFKPAEIILLGHGENSIFEIGLDLRLAFPNLVTHSVIVDVRDQRRVNWAVEKYRPKVIFHAAAHKHVPFMEANIEEAVTTNVLGTQNVLHAAERYDVEYFVLISSDKAVNPSSVMGATKRLAELLVQVAAQRSGRAYMAVRFGNVLGSRGSVIPIFQRQIAAGGPLTITHPDMRRYFMTIPEAVQLVLQASVLGQGGDVFLLDMGEQIRITDLAIELLRQSGLQAGRDVQIVYAGVRPGEKLSEELFLSSEEYRRTKHEKIFTATREDIHDVNALECAMAELIDAAQSMHAEDIIEYIQRIIPEYRPMMPSSSGRSFQGRLAAPEQLQVLEVNA
jgi:FlaA1/EpsC-like NDP-sugar epimerase/lipopolysaccharide/colanic/teichoic acid biosynthesis glycosyltransferase